MWDWVGSGSDALCAVSRTWEGQVHKRLELLQRLLLPVTPDLGPQGVAAAKLALEVLWAAQALELPLHHDGQPGAQGLTFLHAGERGCRPDTGLRYAVTHLPCAGGKVSTPRSEVAHACYSLGILCQLMSGLSPPSPSQAIPPTAPVLAHPLTHKAPSSTYGR